MTSIMASRLELEHWLKEFELLLEYMLCLQNSISHFVLLQWPFHIDVIKMTIISFAIGFMWSTKHNAI